MQANKNALCQDYIKYRAYCLLYDFMTKKEQTLKPLNLPSYAVPFI